MTKKRLAMGVAMATLIATAVGMGAVIAADDGAIEGAPTVAPPADTSFGTDEAYADYVGDPESPTSIDVSGGADYDPTVLSKYIPAPGFTLNYEALGDEAARTPVQAGTCLAPTVGSDGSLTEFLAPVELPDGALMTAVTFFGYDNDATDIFIGVHESNVTLAGILGGATDHITTDLGSGLTSGLAGWGAATVTMPDDTVVGSSGSILFGSTNRFHIVEVALSNSAGSDHLLCGVTVYYQVPATGDNQTFTPLTPCAIYDSRPGQGGAGAFAANETRTATVTGDTTGNGGAGDCGIDSAATAIQVNLLVLNPDSTGTLKVWPTGFGEPNGILPFTNELGRWPSSATVPISGGDQVDIKMQNASAHVRLVVTGYYSPVSNMGN